MAALLAVQLSTAAAFAATPAPIPTYEEVQACYEKAQGDDGKATPDQAGQSFDTFVTRECAYFGMTTKGNRVAEKNGELACRINYYRMRTNVLKNRFLSAAKR